MAEKRRAKRAVPRRHAVRRAVQAGWAALSNGNIAGFFAGRIYTGPLKKACVPGLNCYSCPGALGSCPIGSLQSSLSVRRGGFPFYVCGLLIFFGAVFGRFVCGFLCPFGLVQELLHKIPFPKKLRAFRGDRALRRLKYVILAVFVILLPLFLVDFGVGTPAFCKFICPAGTLEGGLPLVAASSALRAAVGFLYAWKVLILAVTLAASVVIYRPFCKYICPLGAIYGCFNGVSLYRLEHFSGRCTDCGLCARACKMELDPSKRPNGAECIRCGDCVSACPHGALKAGFLPRKGSKPAGRARPSPREGTRG